MMLLNITFETFHIISKYDAKLKLKKLPKIIKFNYKLLKDVDVIFTALPNGEAQRISKKIEQMSLGKIKIDHHAAGELVPAFEVFDAGRENFRNEIFYC